MSTLRRRMCPIRRLLIMIMTIISPINQPRRMFASCAEFGEICSPPSKIDARPLEHQLQIVSPTHDDDGYAQLLSNAAKSRFDDDDYVTYENANQFQKLQEQITMQGRKDEYQYNYFQNNGHASTSSTPNTAKGKSDIQIRLLKSKYRMSNNNLKIASSSASSPQFLSYVDVMQRVGEHANDVRSKSFQFNPNFENRKLGVSLLHPLHEEILVDDTVTNESNDKKQLSTIETFTGNNNEPVTNFSPQATQTQPSSEKLMITTNSATSIKMSSLDFSTRSQTSAPPFFPGTISGASLSSEDSKLISSTFSTTSTTPFQEMATTGGDGGVGNGIGTDTQQQTWLPSTTSSQSDTFSTNEGNLSLITTITEPTVSTTIETEHASNTSILPLTFSTGRGLSSQTMASTTVANEVRESTRESSSYSSKEALAGSTESISQQMTEMTALSSAASALLDDTKSLSTWTTMLSVKIDVTTPSSTVGTTQLEEAPTSMSSSNLISQTSSITGSISNANTTDAENINVNSLPSTESMISTNSAMSSSTQSPSSSIASESPSSLAPVATDDSRSETHLSPKPTTPLTPQTSDKPQTIIDFSTPTTNSPTFFTTTSSTSYSSSYSSSPESEISTTTTTKQPNVGTMSMSTSQIPVTNNSNIPTISTTAESSHAPQMTTSNNELDFGNKTQTCNANKWLECDKTNLKCKCPHDMIHDEERSTCVGKVGRECQTGSGGGGEKLCIKNAACSATTIGQVGICKCQDGFLPGKDKICLPGLGFPCSSNSSACYPGMKCNATSSACSCDEGWSEGKPGGGRCFLNYNAKCDLANENDDNLCNSFTFLNCTDGGGSGKECKCEDPVNQVYDTERKSCVAISSAKCMLRDDSKGRKLLCVKNSDCKVKVGGGNSSSNLEMGNCECKDDYENDWKGNCHAKDGGKSIKGGGILLLSISIVMLKINHVMLKL